MRLTEREKRELLKLAGEDPGPRPNKFGAVPSYYRGIRYDSKAERDRAIELDVLLAGEKILAWFRQVTIRLGVPENVYRVDFLVLPHPGEFDIEGTLPYCEDVKGKETDKFRRDKILWRQYGPLELKVRMRGRVVETIPPGEKRLWLANVGELIGGNRK